MSIRAIEYMANHVFLPPKLPQKEDSDLSLDHEFCAQLAMAATEFKGKFSTKLEWLPRMIETVKETLEMDETAIHGSVANMRAGDVIPLLIRAQNAGVVIRKLGAYTVFEVFEVSPSAAAVMGAKGKLLCSYPGPAVQIPNTIAKDRRFCKELAAFLHQMDMDVLDSAAKTKKAGTESVELRDSAHPRYITQLLVGILRGMGQPAEVIRIQKRIADDVQWHNAKLPWRRSPLWLVIRVALQTSFNRPNGEIGGYKAFMLFFMAKILKHATRLNLSSDMLFCMRAKISHRLAKVANGAPSFVTSDVTLAAQETENLLQERWRAVQETQDMAPDWDPRALDFSEDTHLSLGSSRDCLYQSLKRRFSAVESLEFRPQHNARLAHAFQPLLNFGTNGIITLVDFETSVQEHLDDWAASNRREESAVVSLAACIRIYSKTALQTYASNPENLSQAFLTIFDLWVALDSMVVAQCPLLKDYSCEVPLRLFHSLLIHKRQSLNRLALIERYLQDRHRRERHGSVFAKRMHKDSFAVRYYSTSGQHHAIRFSLEEKALSARMAKKEELRRLNLEYSTLVKRAEELEHTIKITPQNREQHKAKKCPKCRLERQAKGMEIKLHEWPLPDDELEAITTIFELAPPLVFGVWRAVIFEILHDICTPLADRPTTSAEPRLQLPDYSGLREYCVTQNMTQITLGSTTKSFGQSHYRTTKIPSDEDKVCVPNALHFQPIAATDSSKGGPVWLGDESPFSRCSLAQYCALQLPSDSPYSSFQYAVSGTTHTSNDILAEQSDCPEVLSIHEYIAFASLRAGPQLQWLNICRDIAARAHTFQRIEIHTLLTQAALQVGPPSALAHVREWHEEISVPTFSFGILKELKSLLIASQSNWQEGFSVSTIINLTSRILASSDDTVVVASCMSLLRCARDVTYRWVNQLLEKIQSTDEDEEIQEYRLRVCEMAAICRETYDVDSRYTQQLLCTTEDVALLVHCAIIIHDNSPPHSESMERTLKNILARDLKISIALEHLLKDQLETLDSCEGIHLAISRIWPSYRHNLNSGWTYLPSPNDRWITTQTAVFDSQGSQEVHLNLLDGSLLINGKPLGRLPSVLSGHLLYTRIFGQKVLEVVPADMPGMDFASRSTIHGYQVFFSSANRGQPIIRLKNTAAEHSNIFELIPHEIFFGDLPSLVVEESSFWLNTSTREIELRPLDNLWKTSPQNWFIQFSPRRVSTMSRQTSELNKTYLIDVRSATFEQICSVLGPLEHRDFMTVTHSSSPHTGRSLKVDLPRFSLSFFMNNEMLLESDNYPGMIVDDHQSSGTMFGLQNQLLLRSQDVSEAIHRATIIPHGVIHTTPKDHHTSITIDTGRTKQVQYDYYGINSDLGYLVGNGSLSSKLYQVYLHTISGHCLPDPLTKHTGIESALYHLNSGGCRSFQRLGTNEIRILQDITSLTPTRAFYPTHLRSMEEVEWSRLACTVQYPLFYAAVRDIIDHANSLEIVQGFEELPQLRSRSDDHLLERAAFRNVIFYHGIPTPIGAQTPDVVYKSRDREIGEECASASTSALVHDMGSGNTRLSTEQSIWDNIKKLKHLEGSKTEISLPYSRSWLKVDASQSWISLYNLSRGYNTHGGHYELLFSLSAMVYGSTTPFTRQIAPTLLAFAYFPVFKNLQPPPYTSYDLHNECAPMRNSLLKMASSAAIGFEKSSESRLQAEVNESPQNLKRRRNNTFKQKVQHRAQSVTENLIAQWPCYSPSSPHAIQDDHLDLSKLMTSVRPLFQSWYQNRELFQHINQIQNALNELRRSSGVLLSPYHFSPAAPIRRNSVTPFVSLTGLLNCRDAPLGVMQKSANFITPPQRRTPSSVNPTWKVNELRHVFQGFKSSPNRLQSTYGDSMTNSLDSFDGEASDPPPVSFPYTIQQLMHHREQCKDHLETIFAEIFRSLAPSNQVETMLLTSGHWPRITYRSLLAQIAGNSKQVPNAGWKRVLIFLARALALFQHSRRLIALHLLQNSHELLRELKNDQLQHPKSELEADWLLLQVEHDFLARPVQMQVALQMIAPIGNPRQNKVQQLNMGEGKTSVILPMISAALAEGKTLVRVVVLKSLTNQTFDLLVNRLGGLLSRQIYYLPFSRSFALEKRKLDIIDDLFKKCARTGGILVTQPEHILSFKLMSIDRHLHSEIAHRQVASQLLGVQKWLEANSRDILDESDEILRVKHQLVYTVGGQRSLEGHPDRWATTQHLLSLVKEHLPALQSESPAFINITSTTPVSHYPQLRLFDYSAGKDLILLLANDVVDGRIPHLPFNNLPVLVRTLAFNFITKIGLSEEDAQVLVRYYGEGNPVLNGLLLLRGFLAHGLLVYALKERRWRVDYGLDPSRCLLAVPYRAKDVPSLRAEFGHPDVCIILTCLSYYYGGLSENQLDQCFDLLLKLNDPQAEYDKWTRIDPATPENLRNCKSINSKDLVQRTQFLIPLFQQNSAVINFFLSQVVFPKEAKEFPEKLATSGWDIAEQKNHVTTGFSGTNDNSYLLPSSIHQLDDPQQSSTNAKVMLYLLLPENNCYHPIPQPSALAYLRFLTDQQPEIRVLLDVGAQMLEFSNAELVKKWLELQCDIPAAVFFNDKDELMVLTRDGREESLVSSPFRQQLHKCVLYLDDSHTRGTDLKLPSGFRAAVTLGPKVTKDRLVQGCMRMRKLGQANGHSLIFVAPPEVDQAIRRVAKKADSEEIKTRDILEWAMLETCADILHFVPHWVEQGLDYTQRKSAWDDFCSNQNSELLRTTWLQSEARSLNQMYGVKAENPQLMRSASKVPELHQRCKELGVESLDDVRMEEEQEREVNHEVEKERQIQRPLKAKAATHYVHFHVRDFVTTGIITPNSPAFVPLFSHLEGCRQNSPSQGVWSRNLLATKDFTVTVEGSAKGAEEYMRPVQWVVSSRRPDFSQVLVVFSSFEVNELLSKIRTSKYVHLHQYMPRTTYAMTSFDDLRFYCIPPLPSGWRAEEMIMHQLNLWAGQLYLKDYETYLRLCEFLGIYKEDLIMTDERVVRQSDGFITKDRRPDGTYLSCPFEKSPLPYLKELIGLRRKGMEYLPTHMGKILQTCSLTGEDFV